MHNFDTSYAPANQPATPRYKYICPGLAWRFIRSQLMDHDLNGFSTTGRESPHRKPNRISLTRPHYVRQGWIKGMRQRERGKGTTPGCSSEACRLLSAPNQHNSNWRHGMRHFLAFHSAGVAFAGEKFIMFSPKEPHLLSSQLVKRRLRHNKQHLWRQTI